MNRKLVYRYFCDYCRKATCSASTTSKHERGCTKNPNRVCGMCKATEHPQADLPDVIDALQHDVEATKPDDTAGGMKLVDPKLAWVVADFCPACMLSAIRQMPPDDSVHVEWDFQAAKKEFWSNHTEPLRGSDVHVY